MPDVVLALAPHPDDAEIYCGGTLAKLAAEGATVHIVVATDGSKGSFIEESGDLAALRGRDTSQPLFGCAVPILLASRHGAGRAWVSAYCEVRACDPRIRLTSSLRRPYALATSRIRPPAVAEARSGDQCSQLPLPIPITSIKVCNRIRG
jgi:hypothetical protein